MNGSPRIGVLGGSFDPIHLGHLIIAEEAATRLGLDSVVFVPAYNQWRKVEAGVAEAEHRLAMTRLAVEDNARFSASPVDIRREGPTYSVDTLRDVGAEAPVDAELYFFARSGRAPGPTALEGTAAAVGNGPLRRVLPRGYTAGLGGA